MKVEEEHLGEFLQGSGLLSRSELLRAQSRAQERSEPLSRALLESGVLSEEEVRRAVAHSSGIPYVLLSREEIDPAALLLVPEPLCRTYNLVAFGSSERGIEVALLDLSDLSALDFLKHHSRILPRLTSRESLRTALLVYQKQLKDKFDTALSSEENGALEALLSHALVQGASALHLEPAASGRARIRYRIGGILHEALTLSPERAARITSQLKALAGLSASSLVPQESRITLEALERLSVRVSVMPLVSGEKIVLNFSRERDGRKGFTLESLGFHGEALEVLQRALHARTGLIAITGSANSGVSTTLYTLLDLLNHPHRSLASVEREVEYRLPHAAQTQVDESVGLSSTAALRGVLRQDPDVVMLGDIDDASTLSLAAQAAQRCLVLVGINESVDFSPAEIVVRQRLVRRLCGACKEEHPLARAEERFLEEQADFASVLAALKEEDVAEKQAAWKGISFWQAAEGCAQCEGGYLPAETGRGRIGLQEVIYKGEPCGLTIVEDGIFKAAQGLTTIEEVVRVASEMGK